MHKKERNHNIIFTYGALICGIFVGCFLLLVSMVLGCDTLIDKGLEDYNLSVVMNLPGDEILLYVVKKRILQILFFLLIIYILPYGYSAFLYCGSFGVYYGLVITNLIIKYNLSGLLYGLVCFFPHYILYFLVICFLGNWKYTSLNNYYKNVKFGEFIFKIFVIVLLISVSLIWEIRFQKFFLNYFFQYLV